MKGRDVSDYIRWRSGGSGKTRSGVAFTECEERRVREEEGYSKA